MSKLFNLFPLLIAFIEMNIFSYTNTQSMLHSNSHAHINIAITGVRVTTVSNNE